ncbi:MAG: hypothetical protein GC159_07300 [Phycisphaera sp.]|nr:hypothetical protein [Phycisphaera sp.]
MTRARVFSDGPQGRALTHPSAQYRTALRAVAKQGYNVVMDAVLYFLGTLGYYLLNLGWLLALVAGLGMLFFRRTRWWGAGVMSAGVIWVSVFIVIDMKYAADYRRVQERWIQVTTNMTQLNAEAILGTPSEKIQVTTGGITKPTLVFKRCTTSSFPINTFPYWHVVRRTWFEETLSNSYRHPDGIYEYWFALDHGKVVNAKRVTNYY